MFDMGFSELLLIAVIGLVVIGPERLPGVARTVGRQVGNLRRFMRSMQTQLEQEVKLDELNRKIMAETRGQTFRNNDEPADTGQPSSTSTAQSQPSSTPSGSNDDDGKP
ncbi:twin arginine-targeting protein translocase TatB [Saccharospirillum sp. MSK14-1]|uniref:Sec-independent protein translocase protein TatB n=1 Tax=Saccharospirillum sp. MSK14-1 TaxID=1897632 RepID=UPI000D3D43D3|nr:Sec-independent protein translocase protein TatB [Saccharospirillum sp. MSK14-1]PTY37513.1 twin arginine-targeting protein translocase TatB [Saccharospirillum sp. MSK14-1]